MKFYFCKYYFLFLFAIIIVASKKSFSQNISFLRYYLDVVQVFDGGKFRQIEHKQLKSYQIGNNAMAYEDNAGNFKIYYDHVLHNVGIFVDEYIVTNNLVVFSYNNVLKVFDSGKTILLSLSATKYSAGSNIVVWYDDVEHILKAYFGGKIFELDDALARDSVNDFVCGENIAYFIDSRNYTNVFYNEEIITIDYSERFDSLKVGRNLFAFVEVNNNSFQCFYYGELTEIENFRINSYQTGNDFLVYVDLNGYFKVFRNFEVETISFNAPDFYYCNQDIMVYGIQNNFYAYVDGKIYNLENYYPNEIKINNNICLYLDNLGNLKYFDGRKTMTITYEKVTNFELHGNIVKYYYGVNSEAIFWNAKTYVND